MTDSAVAPQASDQYVQSLARGLAVIRAFDANNPVTTLSEVAARTDLTRATARRFLYTLVELGYVSNKADLKSLISTEWRDRTADSIVQAVDTFFTTRVARGHH